MSDYDQFNKGNKKEVDSRNVHFVFLVILEKPSLTKFGYSQWILLRSPKDCSASLQALVAVCPLREPTV